MQNTIKLGRVSFNLIALTGLVVVVAMLVGFMAGVSTSASPSESVRGGAELSNAMQLQPSATAGWVYRHDATKNKWYAHHLGMTPQGLITDGIYELENAPANIVNGCGLDRAKPDC